MGILSFIKEAGEKLFGIGDAKAEEVSETSAAEAIGAHVRKLGLAPDDLQVSYDAATQKVTVSGTAPDQAARERIMLAAGNVLGVAAVDDRLSVVTAEPEAQFHTVARGDTLSAIAKKFYGNANKYNIIFEANRPMLGHPDKIYPGQVLRIPAAD